MINHIDHLEDLVLTQGLVGGMKTLNHLWSIQRGDAVISTKWDGAPSIFAGWDEIGFFVSTKSYLNKTPITYRALHEINSSNLVDDLKDKLMYCLTYLEAVVPHGVVLQGDLLWMPHTITLNDDVAMFHPNTIVYGLPRKWFKESWKLGVAWHSWISKNGVVSHPRFGNILTNDEVLSIDPIMESYDIGADITSAPQKALNDIDPKWLDELVELPNLGAWIKRWTNSKLRYGHNADFLHYLITTESVEIMKLKTDTGKRNRTNKLQFLSNLANNCNFDALMSFQEAVRVSKRIAINSLESNSKVKTWVKTDDGLIPTAHEGYVVNGQSESIKLVNREQFSFANFSADFEKGWNEPTRI